MTEIDVIVPKYWNINTNVEPSNNPRSSVEDLTPIPNCRMDREP